MVYLSMLNKQMVRATNGDTLKELLARSKYLLYKNEDDWTGNQSKRVAILFEMYPVLKTAYELTLSFRNLYKNFQDKSAGSI